MEVFFKYSVCIKRGNFCIGTKFELFKKTSSLVCWEQGLGPHLLFTGHNELLMKLLMEESTQPPVLEM